MPQLSSCRGEEEGGVLLLQGSPVPPGLLGMATMTISWLIEVGIRGCLHGSLGSGQSPCWEWEDKCPNATGLGLEGPCGPWKSLGTEPVRSREEYKRESRPGSSYRDGAGAETVCGYRV